MFLRLDGLLENRFAAGVLLAHSLRCGFHIGKRLWLHRCCVGNDGLRLRIHFQNRTTAGTSHFEVSRFLRHLCESYRKAEPTCERSRMRRLPNDHSHAEEVVMRNLDAIVWGRTVRQNLAHLLRCVGSAHGLDSIDPRDIAAHERESCINESEMQRTANEIVDQERTAADPQSFMAKLRQLRGFQVVREQAAAHQVEAVIAKGKCECVGNERAMSVLQMCLDAIEIRDVERYSLALELLPGCSRHLAESCGDLQHREVCLSKAARGSFNQVTGRGNSTEPAVHAAEVAQRRFYLARWARFGVEDFRRVDPLHSNAWMSKSPM